MIEYEIFIFTNKFACNDKLYFCSQGATRFDY